MPPNCADLRTDARAIVVALWVKPLLLALTPSGIRVLAALSLSQRLADVPGQAAGACVPHLSLALAVIWGVNQGMGAVWLFLQLCLTSFKIQSFLQPSL